MNLRRSPRLRFTRRAWKGVACVAVLFASAPALGQSQSANPYYQNGLEAYAFPSVPNNLALPNQARFSTQASGGGTRYNRFEQFRDELNAIESSLDTGNASDPLRRRSSIGVPYYQSFRQYDNAMGRNFSPGAKADAEFYQKQQDRNARYFEAMKERDPVKRARLLREIEKESQLAARNQAISPKRPTAPDSTQANRAGANASSGPSATTPAAPTTPGATSRTPSRPGGLMDAAARGRAGAAGLPGTGATPGSRTAPIPSLRSRRPATLPPPPEARNRPAAATPRAGAGSANTERPLTPEELQEEARRAGRPAPSTPPLPLPPPR